MAYLFTSESVSEGHPDKIADQISDSILDNFLAFDKDSRTACEAMVTTGQVIVVGEVSSKTYIDVQKVVRDTIEKIGYNDSKYGFDFNSCGVISSIHEQSPDISMGVDRAKKEDQGAGDQGIMFGYAVDETEDYMPIPIYLSHLLLKELSLLRKTGRIDYLRPDSKSQVTMEYGYDNKPNKIDTIVISTQHDDFHKDDKKMLSKIEEDIINILIPSVKDKLSSKIVSMFSDNIKYFINPTGRFVIGGPTGDAGLTGRKIIVDTYGGKGAHGGGAFSGKDSSKVDRSASYAARHIAKNLVAAGVSSEILVQLSYAIGVAEPISIYVNTYNKSNLKISDFEIARKINNIFDLRPFAIEKRLNLREPIYFETSKYGHMGQKKVTVDKSFCSSYFGTVKKRVDLFTWEALDYVDIIRREFNI